MLRPIAAALCLMTAAPCALAAESSITAPGPKGALSGTLALPAGDVRAVAVILPGSGPTDRDGNNTLGIRAQPYRLLAEALARRGIATVRVDKRGLFGSTAADDAEDLTLADYATDARAWVAAATAATGRPCAWLIGHSEGGLIALQAAQGQLVCGLVLVSTPGQPLGDTIRAQLGRQAAGSDLLPKALEILGELESGRLVPAGRIPAPLMGAFGPSAQKLLMSELRFDPSSELSRVRKPVLIVAGGRDLQVREREAEMLRAGDPDARVVVLPTMNHVMKSVPADDDANFASYGDPNLPLATGLAPAVADFILSPN
ncbi:MAG: alpha/beta fold hydrolase [Sphingomonadaceae bacterium]|nr:alpha/beta fold hydrolase [Sphingomonadaceae bacterium]